jgi:hypothetical protein
LTVEALVSRQLGALPVVNHLLARIGVDQALEAMCRPTIADYASPPPAPSVWWCAT